MLAEHGIEWQPRDPATTTGRLARLGTDEKVKLFASLFRGREDVYPVRWESKAGKSGYSPACANEWRAGICEKPRIKCGDCEHRALIPVTGQTVFDHLVGRHTVGVHPLLTDDTCRFLAVDFDDAEWREDGRNDRTHTQRGDEPRLGQLCDIPGLRSWRVAGFPLQWLYLEAPDHLDVVRLVGDRQDVLAILQDAGWGSGSLHPILRSMRGARTTG